MKASVSHQQRRVRLVCALATILSLTLAGCTSIGVKTWERSILAKAEMALTDPLVSALDDHIYFSKEASSGGRGFGGGGCGCN